MHYIVYIILFIYLILQASCLPSAFKIKSGRKSEEHEFPYIVRLERQVILAFTGVVHSEDSVHLCTGVALSPFWTLTAGHCIDGAGPIKELTDNVKIQTVIRYGPMNGSTAAVLSTVRHPSSKDIMLQKQNDLGLLRTEIIQLTFYGKVSNFDINSLSGQVITLAGYRNTNSTSRLKAENVAKLRPLELLNVFVVRYDKKQRSAVPSKCAALCISSVSVCPTDSGGPMLHASGVMGVTSLSLQNIKLCSTINKDQLVGVDFIIPTKPHVKWILEHVKRDSVL